VKCYSQEADLLIFSSVFWTQFGFTSVTLSRVLTSTQLTFERLTIPRLSSPKMLFHKTEEETMLFSRVNILCVKPEVQVTILDCQFSIFLVSRKVVNYTKNQKSLK